MGGPGSGRVSVPLADRFWAKVSVRGPDECWPWLGGKDENGYGRTTVSEKVGGKVRRRQLRAHRVAFELVRGPIPVGQFLGGPVAISLDIDHFRMNPGPRHAPCSHGCVNPAHLEPVTRGENVLRGVSPTACHARKTACVHGHPFDKKNTRRTGGGRRRECRECARRRVRESRHQAAA